MDFRLYNEVMSRLGEIGSDLTSLSSVLMDDSNNAYELRDSDNYANARNRAMLIYMDILVLREKLASIGELYELTGELESEKDKFLVLKLIDSQKDDFKDEVNSSMKFIKTKNLIDYRLIELGKDIRNLYEYILENLEEIVI